MRYWYVIAAALFASSLAIFGFAESKGADWRIELVQLKATGELDDLQWSELLAMIRPGSGFYLKELAENRNPFASITNPFNLPSDSVAGERLFKENCEPVMAHTPMEVTMDPIWSGQGLTAGDSDWAIYRVIQRGRPGTAMLWI